MAARHWVGGGAPNAGDWQQANNWAEGAVPVAADEVYFDRGAQDVDQGLNNAAVNLDLLYVSGKYSGSIGATGTPLLLDQIDDFFYAGVGDEAWFDTADAVNGINNAVIANSGTGADALHLDGFIGLLNVLKGKVTLDTGADAQDIEVSYVTSVASDATLSITAACTLAALVQNGGTVTNLSNITTLTVLQGTHTHGVAGGTTTATTINVSGGTVNYYSNGALTTLDVRGGVFSATGSRGPFTITNASVWDGGTLNLRNEQLNITVTNGVYQYGSGRLYVDHGQRVNVVVL